MTAVLHVKLYGRFKEIKGNLTREKLHRMNQGSKLFGGSFSDKGNARHPI